MQKSKNARRDDDPFAGLPVPDLSDLQSPDFSEFGEGNVDSLLENFGEEDDRPEQGPTNGKKPKAAEATGLAGHPGKVIVRAPRRIVYDLESSKRAVASIGRLPEPDESFHCLMGGDYHGFDLVIAVQSLAGLPVEELTITTLGFNRHNMTHLCGMLDSGRVGRVGVVCSEYFAGADKGTFLFAKRELERRGQTIVSARNHSKVLLFAIGARRFVVESSANLRSCNNLEQFSLCQSRTLFEFHREWIGRVIENGS